VDQKIVKFELLLHTMLTIPSCCAANTRVHEFFETSYFKSGIQPIPGAKVALRNLSRFCNLSVVTYDVGIDFTSACSRIWAAWTNSHFCVFYDQISAKCDQGSHNWVDREAFFRIVSGYSLWKPLCSWWGV